MKTLKLRISLSLMATVDPPSEGASGEGWPGGGGGSVSVWDDCQPGTQTVETKKQGEPTPQTLSITT